MKIYTLTIVYDETKEEIEYISEEMEGGSKSVLEETGAVALGEHVDEEALEFIAGCHIVGEA